MNTLIELPYSPWSLKARWALARLGTPVRRVAYTPLLGEPWLRLRARRWSGRVTVPLLLTAEGAVMGSLPIVQWAASQPGARWAPRVGDPDVLAWHARSERALEAGRASLTMKIARDRLAVRESVPAALRSVPVVADLVGRAGVQHFARKYGVEQRVDTANAVIRAELVALREALGERSFVLGEPTYADIAMAAVFQVVEPLPESVLPLGVRSREHWRSPELAAEFEDLIAYRDRVLDWAVEA